MLINVLHIGQRNILQWSSTGWHHEVMVEPGVVYGELYALIIGLSMI